MFSLFGRLAVIFSMPIASVFRKANAGELLERTVDQYSIEAIIFGCIVTMIIGCIAFILSPEPEGVVKTKATQKVAFSVFGSVIAFIYIAHYEDELNIIHMAWIGGVSYVSPAFIPSLKVLVYELIPVAIRRIKDYAVKFLGGNSNE